MSKGPAGPAGPAGAAGAAGAAGSALAYAHVNANGTLGAPNSKNTAGSVVTAQPGYYCVTSSVTVHNMVVTADVAGVLDSATASFSDPFTSCPAGDIVVSTYNSTPTLADTPFWIAIN